MAQNWFLQGSRAVPLSDEGRADCRNGRTPANAHGIQCGQSYESVDSALLNAWQRLVNTSAYRALLEVLNAARIDRKLRLRISAELVAWGKNLDKQSLTIYQSANESVAAHEGDTEVVMLLNMTRSFMRGLLTQEQYGVAPEETLTYVAKWVELIAPMLKLRSLKDKRWRQGHYDNRQYLKRTAIAKEQHYRGRKMSMTQAEIAEFEEQADRWFAENKPANPGFILPETFMEVGTDQQFEFLRDWQQKVYENGYVGMAWPKEFGGLGGTRCFRTSPPKPWPSIGYRFCPIPLV